MVSFKPGSKNEKRKPVEYFEFYKPNMNLHNTISSVDSYNVNRQKS